VAVIVALPPPVNVIPLLLLSVNVALLPVKLPVTLFVPPIETAAFFKLTYVEALVAFTLTVGVADYALRKLLAAFAGK